MAAVIEKARGRAHAVDCSIAQRALTVQGLSYDNRFAQFPNQHCVFAFVFSRSWFLHFILKLTISPVSIFPPFSVHPWLFSLSHIYHSGFFFFFTLLSLSPNSDVSHFSALFNTIFFPIFTLFLSPSRPCRRYEMYPVCADLQGQILACYKENAGKTLNCSNIAALYLQCVNNAKQVRIYRTKFSVVYHFSYLILVNCNSCFCTWVLCIFVLSGMNEHFIVCNCTLYMWGKCLNS